MVFWLSLPMAKSLDVPPAKVGAAPSVGVWLGFPKELRARWSQTAFLEVRQPAVRMTRRLLK